MKKYALPLGFVMLTLAGGWALSRVLMVVDFQINPIPLILACFLMGVAIGYTFLFQSFGAFFTLWLADAARVSFQSFLQHFQKKTTEGGAPYLETHGGPRLLIRLIPDSSEFDKARETPSRLFHTLGKFLEFASVSWFYRRIPVGHQGYWINGEGQAARWMTAVNQGLAPKRETLALDCCVALTPQQIDQLNLYGLDVRTQLQTRTMYDRCVQLQLDDYLEVLDLKGGLDVRREPGFLDYLETRNRGQIWTILEGSEFFLRESEQGRTGLFEALEASLGCQALLFFHAMTPHKHEVRRAVGVSTASQMVAGWFFRGQVMDLEKLGQQVETYKEKASGDTRQRPRLLRGLSLMGKKVPRANLEVVQQHHRRIAGMEVSPMSGSQQTRALLRVLPGWETASRTIGQHGCGFNADPLEVQHLLSRINGSWCGDLDKPPYLILETTDGQSFSWSPWQDMAYSTVVVGETGSGKSFLLNQLILAHLASSPPARTLIVDYGESFMGLVRAMDGQVIDKHKKDPVTGKPYTFAPLACLNASLEQRPETEWSGLLDDAARMTMDLWLYRVNLSNYTAPEMRTGLKNQFDDAFLAMLREAIKAFSFRGFTYGECLKLCFDWVCQRRDSAGNKGKLLKVLRYLEQTLEAMRSLKRSYLSESARGLDLSRPGALTYFNLDGYPEVEVGELVSIILLNATQLTANVVGVPTLFLIDEFRKLTGAAGYLEAFTEEYLNIVRKYHIAMVLSSQRIQHFSSGILEATQTHMALIQDMRQAPGQWRINDPQWIRLAREASPAGDVGYSTVTLGKKTGCETPVQIGGYFRAPNLLRELFESNKNAKFLAERVAARLGHLAQGLVAFTQDETSGYRTIGSPEWYDALINAFPAHRDWLGQAREYLTETGLANGQAHKFLEDQTCA